jgi:hypothetical protein
VANANGPCPVPISPGPHPSPRRLAHQGAHVHRHSMPQPHTLRAADQPSGPEPVGAQILHRERRGAEYVAIGATNDGALHRSPFLSPRARPAASSRRSQSHTRGRPPPALPWHSVSTVRPGLAQTPTLCVPEADNGVQCATMTRRPRGSLRGCSLMVEHELPKLRARVRFPSPAPTRRPRSQTWAFIIVQTSRRLSCQIRARWRHIRGRGAADCP